MGGRGGAGSNRGSSREGRTLKLPTMTGSEKQVSWAKEILESPYKTLGSIADSYEKQAEAFDRTSKNGGARERKEADAYRAAQSRYAAEISKLPDMKANVIIDRRAAIKDIANNMLKDEYKKRGFAAYEASKL